jgi:hypothetical protein
MQEYNNKSIKDFQSIMSENTEKYIKLKLAYYIKINFPKYEIVKEEFIEEGIFVIISNDINKKIIGIVPTKTESIYGEQFYYENRYLHAFDETYEIKDFTNNDKHFIHEYFNPKKEIPKDKQQIICDEMGGVFVYNNDMMMPSGFYNNIIPKKERTKENLLNNYYIIFQSFYDCAKDAGDDEYRKLINEEAVINFLIN